MADDIRIRVYPTVDKGDSVSELSKIIKDLEKNAKKIKIGLDDKELLSEIAKLKEQINSLSNGKSKNGNSKMFQNETKEAKKLTSEYNKLSREKNRLETQMSKSAYKGQAYKALAKDLSKVEKDMKKVGSQIDNLNKKNIKSDITKSLSNSFESTIKKVDELGVALENSLGKRKLAGNQITDIKSLQRQVENFKSTANLENILKADKPYAEMSKLMTKATELTTAFKKIELTDGLSKGIRKAESDVAVLQNKIKALYTKGYGNSNSIDKLVEKAKKLESVNIKVNSDTAQNDLIKFTNDIKKLEEEYKKLDATMSKQKKRAVFDINVSTALKNLESIKTKFLEVGKDTSQLDSLKTKLQSLNNLTLVDAQKQFSKIKQEINEVSAELPKATSALTKYNKLMSERASLSKQFSTTTNAQSQEVLNRELDENLKKIKQVSSELDKLKNKKIDPDITRSLASSFDTLQKSATKTSQKIDNMFKNKNLTKDQISQLESLRREINNLQQTKLDNILNLSNSHEAMANLYTDLQKINTMTKNLEINSNFNNRIESAYKKVEELGVKLQKLKSIGFVDDSKMVSEIQQVTASYEKIKNTKINIDTDTAIKELDELIRSIDKTEAEINKLTTQSNSNKKDFLLNEEIKSLSKDIKNLGTNLGGLNLYTGELIVLRDKVNELISLPYEEATTKLGLLRKEFSELAKNAIGIKSQADAFKKYNKLVGEQASLEKQLSKTKVGTQSYVVLEQQLKEVNSEIKQTITLLNKVVLPKGNLSSIKNYAKEFSNITNKIDTMEAKLNSTFGNRKLTQNQLDDYARLGDEINKLKNVDLNSILKTDKPYEKIGKLISKVEELDNQIRTAGDNITLGEKISKQTNQAKKSLSELLANVETFKKTKMFGDTQDVDALIQKIKNLSQTKIDLESSQAEKDLEKLISETEKATQEFKELKNNAKINVGTDNLQNSLKNVSLKLDELERKFKKLGMDTSPINNLRNSLQGINNLSLAEAEQKIKEVTTETRRLNSEAKNVSKSFKQMNNSVASSAKKTSSFISNLYSTLSTYSLGNILGMQITKGIYAVKETVVNLDSAFRDLEKVAPANFTGTEKELQKVKDMAYEAGQEVARSSVDIINSTASAFQLGIDNLTKAVEYAKNVNMYANVADIDETSADKYLKSIATAYGGVAQSLEPMIQKVKGASESYSMLTDYMDQANYCLIVEKSAMDLHNLNCR